MSIDARLNRIAPALTARERGVLVLRSMKDKTPENPAWRRTMPPQQIPEFNRFIGLMNACNTEFAMLITFIESEVEKIELRLAWWFCMRLWHLNLAEIDFAAAEVAREAITASEHQSLVERTGASYLPVSLLAVELADRERAWSNDDLEPLHDASQELVVRDEPWGRIRAEAEKRLSAAAAAGEIEARGKGAGLKLCSGSFDAWLGRPVKAYPQWAGDYEVLPDDQAAQVAADRATLANLREAIERDPLSRMAGVPAGEPAGVGHLTQGLEDRLVSLVHLRWNDLRCTELVIDGVAADFSGEDPLKPRLREALETSKAKLLSATRQLAPYRGDLELVEPTEDDLLDLRELLAKGVARAC